MSRCVSGAHLFHRAADERSVLSNGASGRTTHERQGARSRRAGRAVRRGGRRAARREKRGREEGGEKRRERNEGMKISSLEQAAFIRSFLDCVRRYRI